MAFFNLRLSFEHQRRLSSEAHEQGISRSDVTREALDFYFRAKDRQIHADDDIEDDWADFGGKVIAAHKQIMEAAFDKISDGEWAEVIEPIYEVFKQKAIDKSRAYTNPALFTKNRDAPFGARVVAALGFASDDVHEISVDLEDMFFEYGQYAGDEAFAEIPAMWERAKARLNGGEPESRGADGIAVQS